MKKIISIILILCITACGAVPKSNPPDSCVQEKQQVQACENQKQTCQEEKNAYQTILKYVLPALGFATLGFVAGKN